MQETALTDLKPGQEGHIRGFENEVIGSKLIAMGILPGRLIVLIRKAPMGGAWYVRVDLANYALRHTEAASIIVQPS